MRISDWSSDVCSSDLYTADHLFGEIWNREGLSFRDRRLLLIGLLVGRGLHDVIDIQMEAALKNEELTESALREIVLLLAPYPGWPDGAQLNAEIGCSSGRESVRQYVSKQVGTCTLKQKI